MKGLINYRSLIKQVYRYSRNRSYRHSEKIWPYVQIQRQADGCMGNLRYLGKAIPVLTVAELSQRRKDDLVIIASGPSIQKVDLGLLKNADWMAVNGAVNILDRYPAQALNYYVVIDQGFAQDQIGIIASVVSNPNVTFVTNLFCLNKVYELLGRAAVKAKLVLFEDRQKPVYLPRVDFDTMGQRGQNEAEKLVWQADKQVGFSLDLYRGYVSGGTVVYLSLQLAAAMGYKRVYLAGVDMTRFNEPRFYENQQNRLGTRLDVEFEKTIYPSFYLAAQIFQQLGMQGYNLCLDSGLDDAIFPRIDLAQHLGLQDAS